MKKFLKIPVFVPLSVLLIAPLGVRGDTFFADYFTNSSTINSLSPVNPTTNSTSYEMVSSKGWSPTPAVGNGDLKFGIASTSSGSVEVQALFATNAIALTQVGDYIQLTVVFTNTAGLLTANGALGFGLYNSGQVKPVAGGLNGTATTGNTTAATGGAQLWQGYVGQIGYSTSTSSRIMTRPPQTSGTANNDQDLVTSGSGSSSYTGATTVGSTVTANVILTAGATYTEVLTIALNDANNSLAITNILYSGPDTSGTVIANYGGIATNTTYLTSGFDALAIGWRETGSQATTMDISSISVSGQVTAVSGPPTITLEPVPTSVPNGGSCAFFSAAEGFSVTYQWHRNGTNLINSGNISGATSPTLIISPAGTADLASGANGYYVTVSGAGGYSTNSFTNSLSFRTAANLTWVGPGADWDLATSANWQDASFNQTVFNFGDAVTFNGSGPGQVNLTNCSYLSASSVTISANTTFSGTGSFAGPGSMNINDGCTFLDIKNANTYSGGTVFNDSSASALLYLENYNGLGNGPLTIVNADPGASLTIVPAGSGSVGLNPDIVVSNDFTIKFNGSGSFACVLFGAFSGPANKTLTLSGSSTTTNRIRAYNTNIVYNGNLVINGAGTVNENYAGTTLAPYNNTGSQTYNGIISGSGGIVQRANGTTYLNNGQNTYSGGTTPTTGTIAFGADTVGTTPDSGPIGTGPLYLAPELPNTTGSGTVLASGGARSIANPIQYPSATNNLTLIIGGSNNLTFTGPFTLNGNDSAGAFTNRIVQANNTGLTTFSGMISDGGLGFGLTKSGTGVMVVDNTETYTGPTAVSNGTLLVNGSLGSGAVTVVTNATLGGTGSIGGTVTILNGGTLSPGASIGTLTINNNLTLNGNARIEVNKSLSPGQSNDVCSVSGVLTNGGTGTLVVSNLGPALVQGDTFKLFNKAVQNGGALNVIGGGTGVNWNNNLATDGTISVASITVGGPVITSTEVSGGKIVMSGTNGTAGSTYYVLATTNLTTPRASWSKVFTNIFGAGGVFSVTNPVSGTEPSKFYLLQVP